MSERTERDPDERGLSARHLILVFLAGVAVCGVFFSLGFLVGFNERSSQATPVTEHVTASPVIPPTVNAPPETTQPGANGTATATTMANPPAESPISSSGSSVAESNLPPPAANSGPAPASTLATSKAETPAAASIPTPAPGQVGLGFTVQVVASRTKEDAESLVKILKARSYPVFLVAPEYAHANDNLFRVQVGPFTTREDAEKIRVKLAQEGFKPFIRH